MIGSLAVWQTTKTKRNLCLHANYQPITKSVFVASNSNVWQFWQATKAKRKTQNANLEPYDGY